MKKKVIILMLVLLGLSWYIVINNIITTKGNYETSVNQAQKHDTKEMYLAAIEDYKNILSFGKKDKSTFVAMANDYYATGQFPQYVSVSKQIIEDYDADYDFFNSLMNYYEEKNDYEEALSYLHVLMDKFPEKEYITEKYNSLKGVYKENYNSFSWVGDFYNGYVACQSGDGQYSSVNYKDEIKAPIKYSWAGPYSKNLASTPVMLENGNVAYVDEKGNKILVPDTDVKYLGISNGSYILAQHHNGKYGYIKENCADATEFKYENATAIVNDFGAVQLDGKWAIVNSQIEPISEFIYDDVIMDDNHVATRGSVIWVKTGDGYQLVNSKGEVLTSEIYEDARPFAAPEPSAAKKDGKWGFVNTSGSEITEFIYDDAKSFCCGFAPIFDDQLWIYIDCDGRNCIDDFFTDAKVFDKNGVAFVQKSNTYWVMIKLIDKQ